MGLEEKLPSGILLTSVEKIAGWARARAVWPATFGLACCGIEAMNTAGPRHDMARFGMEKTGVTPREADLMIVSGRVSQKMGPVLRQVYDQMPDPKWVISMGVCASSGGMFNNYAVVQGVDHIVPVDIYLPGCPPRPEMLMDAILKLRDKIANTRLGANRDAEITAQEQARLRRLPLPKGHVARPVVWIGARSDVECQLGQATGSPVAAVARRAAARHGVPARDQAHRCGVHRTARCAAV